MNKLKKIKKGNGTRKTSPIKSNQRSGRSSRKQNDYLATLSHDLRTPLNAVIGFSEMISTGRAGKITREQREYLKDIIVSGKELLRLIKNAAEHCRMSQTRQGKKGRT